MKYCCRIALILAALIMALLAVSACSYAEMPAEQPPKEDTEPAAETGERHWYFFQPVTSGFVSSVNQHYLLMPLPYFTLRVNGTAIGKVKGVNTTVLVYTHDPEERVIWVSTEEIYGDLVRSDVQLPDPDFESGDISLSYKDQEIILPETARSDLLALQESIDISGEAVSSPELENDSDISIICPEIPMLRYWNMLSIARYDNHLVLVSWNKTADKYEPERIIEIDPESALYQAYFTLLEEIH